jgi:hypothetical protein
MVEKDAGDKTRQRRKREVAFGRRNSVQDRAQQPRCLAPFGKTVANGTGGCDMDITVDRTGLGRSENEQARPE